MAEIAGAYMAESVVEGAAVATYGVAKSTMPLNGQWMPVRIKSPLPRSSHSLCVINGKAYIFGGEVQPRVPVDNDVHVISVPSGLHESADYVAIKSKSAPPPRVGHTAVALGHRMYVFGGRGGKEMKPLEEKGRMWCFDTRVNDWSVIDPHPGSPTPEARSYHASAPASLPLRSGTKAKQRSNPAETDEHGIIFVHAGCQPSGRLADLWAFDLAAQSWKRFPDAPGLPRGGAALACTNERLFRFGGFDGNDEIGGQIDFLELPKDAFPDRSDAREAPQVSDPTIGNEWQSLEFKAVESSGPGPRSVAGLHHITVGQGRNYLVLMLGERSPSGKGHDGAGSFWDDIWTFQLKPEVTTAASFKDTTRQLIGMKTREYDWEKVQLPETSEEGDHQMLPGPRGWFASSILGDLDRTSIVLWGGINETNERLADGYFLKLE